MKNIILRSRAQLITKASEITETIESELDIITYPTKPSGHNLRALHTIRSGIKLFDYDGLLKRAYDYYETGKRSLFLNKYNELRIVINNAEYVINKIYRYMLKISTIEKANELKDKMDYLYDELYVIFEDIEDDVIRTYVKDKIK